MTRRFLRTAAALMLVALVIQGAAASNLTSTPTQPGTSSNFTLIGSNDLFARGMNAAPALYNTVVDGMAKTFVYIGNRTDGAPHHLHSGVLIVDSTNPASPSVVGEIGPPNAGNLGETTREVRVWPQKGLLIVLTFGCSAILHACPSTADATSGAPFNVAGNPVPSPTVLPRYRFYDIGANPTNPPLVRTYVVQANDAGNVLRTLTPHEFYLWVDPDAPSSRALLFMTTPSSTDGRPNLVVSDISNVQTATPTVAATWIGTNEFSSADRTNFDVRLHSIGVTADGSRTYLAFLGGGYMALDTSAVANGTGTTITSLTPAGSLKWGDPGAHSAIKIPGTHTVNGVPGRTLVLMTDEVYGDAVDAITGSDHGCPWGWVRILDTTNPGAPTIVGTYKIPENDPAFCASSDGQNPLNTYFTSFSAHNPTALNRLAFVTWHSGGLQAIDLTDPTNPTQAGFYVTTPLPLVGTEDPALSSGNQKVVAWSYPILNSQNGQTYIYIVDVRNGLQIFRYEGVNAADVDAISFLEGNSNLGSMAGIGG
jgi:hypothetical protein